MYDPSGRVSSIATSLSLDNSGSTLTSTAFSGETYYPGGAVDTAKLAIDPTSNVAGIALSRTYDNRGRITGEVDTDSLNTIPYQYSLNYDANGNVTGYKDSVAGTWTASYDALHRWVKSTGTMNGVAATFQQTYDHFGNRNVEYFTYNGTESQPSPYLNFTTGNNRAAGSTYDNAGNLYSDGTNDYLYDAENRLCAVKQLTSGDLIGYVYAGNGPLLGKGNLTTFSCDVTKNGLLTANGLALTNAYMVGPQSERLEETDGNFNMLHYNVFWEGKLLGTFTGTTYAQSNWHFALNDWVGTKREISTSNGAPCTSLSSGPFGDYESQTGPCSNPSEEFFTSKVRDTESGLDNFLARHYSSNWGRFMSPDYQSADDDDVPDAVPNGSLTNPQTLNLYSFTQNNPLSRRDYDGHASWGDCADGSGDQCFNGDYNGERNCQGSSGCLFWNSQSSQWQGTDPTAKPDPSLSDMPGMAFTGLTRLMLGDRYGAQQTGYAYARTLASVVGGGALVPKPTGTPLGRPAIVPKGWIEKPGSKGKGGTEYIDPNNPHNRVRVMPGNPNSPNPAQREPYMVVKQNGQYLDSNLNEVEGDSVDAHIPVDTPMDSPFIP